MGEGREMARWSKETSRGRDEAVKKERGSDSVRKRGGWEEEEL